MNTRTFNTILMGTLLLICNIQLKAEIIKKEYRSWPVSKVSSLAVENKFGNIRFMSTRSDSVTISITIDTDDKNSRSSERLAEQIDFAFSFTDGKIGAQTIFSKGFRSKEDFSVNYLINIPIDKNLEVNNSYGNVTLDDLKAKGSFKISYGNFNGNTLLAPGNEQIKLDLKYGSATIENANRLRGNISYSKLRTTSINDAELETRYSTIYAEKYQNINANSRYDNYTITNVQHLRADTKFTDWKIDEATTSIDFINEYGDVRIRKVPKTFQHVAVDNRYGNIRIGISAEATYSLKAEAFYCNIIYPNTKPDSYFKEDNHFKVEAIIGSRNANSKVKIESRYGKVDLME